LFLGPLRLMAAGSLAKGGGVDRLEKKWAHFSGKVKK